MPSSLASPPRWVKVTLALTLASMVVIAIIHLAGGGFRHGPTPHGPSSGSPSEAPHEASSGPRR